MFGGLLYGTDVNWLAQVFNIFINDPIHNTFNWYTDVVASQLRRSLAHRRLTLRPPDAELL
jgi:hypothetical protein